ncbi:hypothetical protein JYU34_016809 [Plutella xylostella]|uniref:Uncharacterized protein n=1 Tax=Plutella xylostella TaxID=51655 RepID=A0ABQ7Q3I6_PLUXY|nr:hypothetical protein JYU34_016809 [Plutella xylostella]
MRCLVIIAAAAAVVFSEPAPAPAPEPVLRLGRERNDEIVDAHIPRYWLDEKHYNLVPWVEPTRGVIAHSGSPHEIAMQNKIVRDVYSPSYSQPTYIIDYRFLKSGGRAYTRSRGGEVLILPKAVKTVDPSGQDSYDRLIDHLKEEELKHHRQEENRLRDRDEKRNPWSAPEVVPDRSWGKGWRQEEPELDEEYGKL